MFKTGTLTAHIIAKLIYSAAFGDGWPGEDCMLYQYYELQRASLEPMRLLASSALSLLDMPGNPLRPTALGRYAAAALDSFEHNTQYFGKPAFGHRFTSIDGAQVAVTEEVVHRDVWCDLLHFRREVSRPNDPTLLIVAPLSGHFATLLRGTVEAFLPDHDVYITDWANARDVPVAAHDFDLDDYIDTVIGHLHHLGPHTHVLAVCQPAVPVLAATALMNAADDALAPATITLIGGPIDTREAPTEVNTFAKRHSLDWFANNVIHRVPLGSIGFMRRVYPGFMQLAGFMAMNLDRHMEAHWQMFMHLVDGDGESLDSKRAFYTEYKSVMDMPADYYLQTISAVFQDHLLPRGLLISRERPVECAAITKTALLTIEGERDDISGIGQTRAAHALCRSLPEQMKQHYEQKGVGHYGLFNGSRFKAEIAPRIKAFIART
jgi:poly(3-hydroxybutyrate) depolymerase